MRYGWRGKIALIYPAPGLPGEIEFHQMAPDGVAALTTRIPFEKITPEELERMGTYIDEASSLLAQAKPDVIVFGCTIGSLVKGIGYDQEIIKKIENLTGIPALTTSTAVIDSLNALGVKRVAIATPYPEELNRLEKAFIEASGFEVTAIKTLEAGRNRELRTPHMQYIHSEDMYRLAKDTFTEDADCMFLSCTGLGLIDVIEALENDLQKPVVASNQASMWAALRKIGIKDRINGLGKLFRI